MKTGQALRDYWLEVKEGIRPKPERRKSDSFTRVLGCALDGSFGPDADKPLIVTVHLDGRLDIRPKGTRRTETVHLLDVYRFAIRCRVDAKARVKAKAKKDRRAVRLAAQRQERAEKKLSSICQSPTN